MTGGELAISDALLIAAVTGITSGAAAWGAISVQLKWLRSDLVRAQETADKAHERLDAVIAVPGGRRAYDQSKSPFPEY